jgi:prepilin-type N-terminal cleavage/methylation domain-containing protein
MNKQKGFTLIELLVVIAIIGLLAGIVLVSLGDVRTRARDTRVEAALSQVRTVAELVYDDNNSSYSAPDSLCNGTVLNTGHADYAAQLTSLGTDMDSQNGGNPAAICYADGGDYCVSVLNASNAQLCVSDAGIIGNDECSTTAPTVCQP